MSCLFFADLPTRIRVSHLSRAWRQLSLSECGLWADFGCTTFVSYEDQLRTYEMLQTMLQRSSPLPFSLRIPHKFFGSFRDYASSIISAVGGEAHRLQVYDGEPYVFYRLYTSRGPLPALVLFVCRDNDGSDNPRIEHSPDVVKLAYDGLRLPDLRRLVGPVLHFSEFSAPYTALRDLVCTIASYNLFSCCPNLVTAEFLGVQDDARLPFPPMPHTLRHITLHGLPGKDAEEEDGVSFAPLLSWKEASIPTLTLLGAQSIRHPFAQFLAQGNGLLSLSITSQSPDIILTTRDGRQRLEIGTCAAFWGSRPLAYVLELLSGRLAHLSICIEHINEFFDAQFDAPRLVSLELSLTGVIDDSLPTGPSEFYFLRAPGLQHFALEIGGSDDDVHAYYESYINGVLDALRRNFRSLLLYDADVLESVTVRARARVVKEMNLSDFAFLARRFIATSC